jgi:lysyl-tRNA synthetase class II
MQQRAKLDQTRFGNITDDIQSHNSDFHLPMYPTTDADVEEFTDVFEDVGYFVTQDLIDAKMAYASFSNDIERSWCNVTVQETIQQERATDKSKTAQRNPIYGNFEMLAKEYLKIDGLSCKDLDRASKKKTKKSR